MEKKKKKRKKEERTFRSREKKKKKKRECLGHVKKKERSGHVEKKKNLGGHYGKTALRQFSLIAFPPDLGGKKFVSQTPWFSTPPVFFLFLNRRKLSFPLYFPSYIFHSS